MWGAIFSTPDQGSNLPKEKPTPTAVMKPLSFLPDWNIGLVGSEVSLETVIDNFNIPAIHAIRALVNFQNEKSEEKKAKTKTTKSSSNKDSGNINIYMLTFLPYFQLGDSSLCFITCKYRRC